jgi:hypothetical protein
MSKRGSIGLLAMIVACGGGDDSGGDCVPGDSSRLGYSCSQNGEWVESRSTVRVLRAPDPAICPDLAPGSYVLKRTLASGGIDCPQFPDEVVVKNSDGSVTGLTNPLIDKVADSCSEVTTVDGCALTVDRSCTINDCSAKLLLSIDIRTWAGAQSMLIVCPDGSSLSCTHDAWYESR